MKMRLVSFTLIIVMLMANSAAAFDGQRKGFILGGGLGAGITSYTLTSERHSMSYTRDRENRLALMSDFRIGYAPSEQLEIFYTNKVSWFKETDNYTKDVTISSGLGSIGFSYSSKLSVPTMFLTGGIGLSTASMPFEDDAPDPMQGFGLFGGFGCEWSRHFCWELDLLYSRPKNDYYGWEIIGNAISIKFTINALAY